MGMMKMWGSNKMAKYIMPMMSADTKRHVMEQIQEEAKEAGIELPPIFEDLDAKTGLPRILAIAVSKISFLKTDKYRTKKMAIISRKSRL